MAQNQVKNKFFGFTLIELLVVISVLGLLSTLAVTALNSARIKARDARRKSDLIQIGKALDLYYDKYNHYPLSISDLRRSNDGQPWIPGLNEFLPVIPVDPKNDTGPLFEGGDGHIYLYNSDWNSATPQYYDLLVVLESAADPDRCAIKVYKWRMGENEQAMCEPGATTKDGQYFVISRRQ